MSSSAARTSTRPNFRCPKWHYLEGGRYIHTFTSVVTKDPDTGVMNVGLYRGMIGQKDTSPFLLIKGGQHWGAHFVKWAARGQPMPVACVIGWDPIMSFLSGSPLPSGVCEYDVMGGYRGEPAQLVRARPSISPCRRARKSSSKAPSATTRPPMRRRTVRRIYRLRLGPADAAAIHENHLHHPPPRSGLLRLAGGHAARV